ncbi:MAG: hypothetical protein H7323_12430 [Frankiales bacterium]|nr:hypothetical protein [Frankiales bacterium]
MTSTNGDTTAQARARAQELLGTLAQDQARLVPRLSFPSWLLPTLGAVAATYVAGPAILDDDGRQSSLLLGVMTAALLSWWARRQTGVLPRPLHRTSLALLVLWLVVLLAMLSTSLGLASFDLRWWVLAPAAVTVATTLWIGRRIETVERARVAHGD